MVRANCSAVCVVEVAGRLVEDQDLRPLEQRAGDGDALLLAAGKADAVLADLGLVALRQVLDRRRGSPPACRRATICSKRACGLASEQVVVDRAREEHRLLRHDAEVAGAARWPRGGGCRGRRSGRCRRCGW